MSDEPIPVNVHDALIAVDIQRDFCPGGALAVPEGDEVVPITNRIIAMFGLRVFTRDWHPLGHISFSTRPEFHDGSWPAHAVQGTPGVEWCSGLNVPNDALVVSKGEDPLREAYSGFQASQLDLAEFLRSRGIERVFVTGLATDYCVRRTALDARTAGFTVYLVEDAIRGTTPETTFQAIAEMNAAGVRRIVSTQLRGSDVRPTSSDDKPGDGSRR